MRTPARALCLFFVLSLSPGKERIYSNFPESIQDNTILKHVSKRNRASEGGGSILFRSLLPILCSYLIIFWVRGGLGHPVTALATVTCVTCCRSACTPPE